MSGFELQTMDVGLDATKQALAREPYSDEENSECHICHHLCPNRKGEFFDLHFLCDACKDDGNALHTTALLLLRESVRDAVALRQANEDKKNMAAALCQFLPMIEVITTFDLEGERERDEAVEGLRNAAKLYLTVKEL